jgi:DNA-binding MarR family transcriptional regulator
MTETLDTTLTDSAARLRLAIVRTSRRLRQEAAGAVGELTPTSVSALATVERHGPLTPSELAAKERVQRPTATRVIARLEEERLIQRTADLYDKRSSLVAVTKKGEELLAELRTRKTAFLAERLETLEPEERATLERAADILERVLER